MLLQKYALTQDPFQILTLKMGKINLVVILTDMELHENAFQNELKLKI